MQTFRIGSKFQLQNVQTDENFEVHIFPPAPFSQKAFASTKRIFNPSRTTVSLNYT